MGDCRECYGEYEEEGEEEMTYADDDGSRAETCSIGHEEIVYFTHRCPLYDAQAEIEAYKDSIESLLVALNEDYTVVLP